MDGLKLDKWKENFREGIASVQIEFDSFFKNKKLNQFYEIKEDEVSQSLSLVITDNSRCSNSE